MKTFSRSTRRAGRRRLLGAVLGATTASLLLSTIGLAAAPAAEAAGSTCLSGTLDYVFASAESGTTEPHPARAVTWELWGRTGTGSTTKLNTGITSSTGAYNACSATSALSSAYVRFIAGRTGLWKVIDKPSGGTSYTATTAAQYNVSGSRDLGTTTVSDGRAGAFKIADVAGDFYALRGSGTNCWTRLQDSGCRQLTFVWTSTRTDGGYFDLGDTNYVILAQNDPRSAHLILHESGHWFQWALYNGWFPAVTGCASHFVDKASSPSCAWTEGFANAVAGWVLGDERWVRANGTEVPYEPVNGGSYEGGDAVEGNVAAALIDLWEFDGPNGTWDANIDLTTRYGSDDFRDYFLSSRTRYGLPTDQTARDIIASHGIDY